MPLHDASTILEPYRPGDEISIRQLLIEADLVIDDLVEKIWPHFIVLRINDRLAGAAAIQPCSPHIGLLRSVVLTPAARQKGFGRILVAGAESLARGDGLTDFYLLTNTAAPFFGHLGYQVIDRDSAPEAVQSSAEFGQLCPETAIVMFKSMG